MHNVSSRRYTYVDQIENEFKDDWEKAILEMYANTFTNEVEETQIDEEDGEAPAIALNEAVNT